MRVGIATSFKEGGARTKNPQFADPYLTQQSDDPVLLAEMRVQQLAAYRRQLPYIGAAQALNSVIVAFVAYDLAPLYLVFGWTLACWLSAFHCLRSWWRHRGMPPMSPVEPFHLRKIAIAALVNGLVWGIGGGLLFYDPAEPLTLYFLLVAVGGMAAGAVAALTSVPLVGAGFTVGALVPLSIRPLTSGDLVTTAFQILIFCFVGFLTLAARNGYRTFRERVRAEFEVRRSLEGERALNGILRTIANEQSLSDRLEACLESLLTVSWLQAMPHAAIYLREDAGRNLARVAQYHGGGPIVRFRPSIELEDEICAAAARERRIVDLVSRNWSPIGIKVTSKACGLHCVPVLRENELLGVILLGVPADYVGSEAESRLLGNVAEVISLIVQLHFHRHHLGNLVNARTADLKRAMEQVELANRAKAEFLAHISHELRTPLNAIIGFSDMLHRQMFGELGHAKYRDYADSISAASGHLLELLSDVIDISRMDIEQLELSNEAVDVGELAEDCRRVIQARARNAGILMSVAVPCDLPVLYGDRLRLRQVLLNLLNNAIKFTPTGGRVAMKARIDGDRLVISVEDTGIGIAKEDHAKVLEPFGQVADAYRRKPEKGIGIGLALSRMLIERQGGTLHLMSAPDEGTTVELSFPIATRVADHDRPQVRRITGGPGR